MSTLNDSWTYDRYGNRWGQTAAPSGYQGQIQVDPATNHAVGFAYDAAGNVLTDANHSYLYDAEGNMTGVDGGKTSSYDYDAGNLRVREDTFGTAYEFLYDLDGHKQSITDVGAGVLLERDTRLGGTPLAVYLNGGLSFEHQDWVGTERFVTTGGGDKLGSYVSNPFGDVFQVSGNDVDPYHFAGLEHEYESGLEHAQFRQYASAGGRWMSPDPYAGSYDWTNPQSLNRYSYALNDPLSANDPTGLNGGGPCDEGPNCDEAGDSGGGSGFGDGNGGGVGGPIDVGSGYGEVRPFTGMLRPLPTRAVSPVTRAGSLFLLATTCQVQDTPAVQVTPQITVLRPRQVHRRSTVLHFSRD